MDDKDFRVLEILKENSKLTTKQIAKKLNLPITTVHNRIKKLERNGIVKNYTVVLDHKKLGRNISSYVLVTVRYDKEETSQERIAREIKGHHEVEEVSIVAGGTDILARVRVGDIDDLNEFIIKKLRNINGVDRTQTMIVLSSV